MNPIPLVVSSCTPRLINSTSPHRVALARGPRLPASGKYTPRPLTCSNDYKPQTTWRASSNVPRSQQAAATQTMSSATSKQKPSPAVPRPSSSVILVSPRNEILLLHRVKTSTSFASAHVFPGGNLSAQDGQCPPAEDLKRHDDGSWYRNAAIRELFEESGILLAKDNVSGKMLSVPEEQRESGRRAIHQNQTTFLDWLRQQSLNAVPDTDGLIPFTRWITPTTNTRRYTTQMYLYFLPLPAEAENPVLDEIPSEGQREEIQVPTSDGGVEVTEARFLPASEWLQMAQKGEIILFPPQFLLLHLVAGFLDKEPRVAASLQELRRRRAELTGFVNTGQPPWSEKCISPKMLRMSSDGRTVLALDQPGPEFRGTDKHGETERVVLVRFKRGEARDLEVRWKKDAFEGEAKSNL
ncbi:hypothetical protein BP00DRAFT_396715 [Aspergillus indologenus CBS 114.80]|uniref:Nudix hydrolase domain-containing protein n=1 Tax=Aspergillus indologenus CBS 114.80 TaxID=1450541 RepID=A0A2V5I5H2_9EURO|nr:hypothetical protein BP00DRAFT_396715 [Aspergillus indologenus CBS 114.80]